METFCTISTFSHLYKTYALADSIRGYGGKLYVLLIDSDEELPKKQPENIVFCTLKDVDQGIGNQIITKYQKNKDKLRWALKPVFLSFLLNNNPQVIYVDNDIYFFGNYSFLFDELNSNSLILTPHFYPSNPQREQNWLEANFRVGLYNAGFIGVNRNAKQALNWWAECCLYNMKKSYWRGLFDDQKYLDLFPILFDNVKVLKHKGCNLAGWNYKSLNVSRDNDDEIIIDNKYSLIFIHFAELSMLEFSNPNLPFFKEYSEYVEVLNNYNNSYKFKKNLASKFSVFSYLYFIRWRIARMLE